MAATAACEGIAGAWELIWLAFFGREVCILLGSSEVATYCQNLFELLLNLLDSEKHALQ